MQRNEVKTQYKWKTEDVFQSDEQWEKEYSEIEKEIDFQKYRGTLNTAENLLAYFKAEEKVSLRLMRLYLYAFLKSDEDVRVSKYASMNARVMSLFTRMGAEISFSTPEISALPEETLSAWIKDDVLKDYDYQLSRIAAQKKYILSEKEERILAQTGEPLEVAYDAFGMLDNAELDLPEIEYEGKKTKLSHGLYSVILGCSDQKKREEVFRLYYSAYRKIIGTLAVTYYGNVKKDIFYKNVRGYRSCLDMALFEEDVDRSVYENLVRCVNAAAPIMHLYMRVRKKALALKEMHVYDLFVPLVKNAELKLEFEEAYDLILNGLSPLGEEYRRLLKKGKEERWIDVYETEGKRNGAYSIGVYGQHPYVLLNYQKTAFDVFAIAHEMGHALHSYFSNLNQPYSKSEYKIFVAEVASTVNEVLLLKYLLKTTQDQNLKKYLLNYFMDMIRTTLFRQTQFAQFEEKAHEMAESGEPLNKDNLSSMYYELNRRYYGDALTHDRDIEIKWARIPHFYRSFYVYKYATGITSAVCIANRILNEGEKAVKDYFKFLSGGSSTDPVSLLKIAGADLNQEETYQAVMKEFEAALDEFERII